ncbi:HAMP domain-containing histidine kinase [bacterium]|nr:HAMP domain-containing histidine kinase [bacterium]
MRQALADGGHIGGLRARAWVFVAISAVAIVIFLYTNSLIRRLEVQSATLSRSIAGLCATATYAAREDEELSVVFGELIGSINFPIIISDVRGVPITWRGLPFEADPEAVTHEEYITADPSAPPDSPFGDVMRLAAELDRRRSPMPMTYLGDETVLGYIHYGESNMIREMRFVPAVEIAAFGVLLILGFPGFRNAKIAALRAAWVGIAKETAHQLGTPISSLMGWTELLRETACEGCASCTEADRMAAEMQTDLARLEKISLRFNQIGSIPKTERQDLVILLRESVNYLRTRLPSLTRRVEIIERYDELPLVDVNRELIEWVIENLVKNSLEALPPGGGRIEITTEHAPKEGLVRVLVTDNGKGMSPRDRRRIFLPGVSTKRKGWGLGLVLARRIVEEYHKGRLYVGWSEEGKGTTLIICLPTT